MRYLLLLLSSLILINCSEEKLKPAINYSLGEGELPTQESWDAVIQISEDDRVKAILYAEHLYVYENKKVTHLEGVKLDFLDEDGNVSSTLTSKKGKVDDATKDMFAIDSVVAVNDSGVVLRTDELVWKNRAKKITTDKFVTIDDKDDHMEGYGFESDERLTNYKIYKVTYITTNVK